MSKFQVAARVIQAAERLAEAEHKGPPHACRVMTNGCDCGVAAERNERRAEFYRLLRELRGDG